MESNIIYKISQKMHGMHSQICKFKQNAWNSIKNCKLDQNALNYVQIQSKCMEFKFKICKFHQH
jgi:hypothetical protein